MPNVSIFIDHIEHLVEGGTIDGHTLRSLTSTDGSTPLHLADADGQTRAIHPNDRLDLIGGEQFFLGMAQDPSGRARNFTIQVAVNGLHFREHHLLDPMPLGRQILAAAGLNARLDCSLFAVMDTGDFEDVRLDETFDLRGRGTERFVAFQSDHDFKFTVNDAQIRWGLPTISGSDLYNLAQPRDGEAVYLVHPGSLDQLIEPSEQIALSDAGVEHFITAASRHHGIHIVVNGREMEVQKSHQTFEQLVALAYPGEPPMSDSVYSITFRKVASNPHSGELAAGGFVDVKNGSLINVCRTIQS